MTSSVVEVHERTEPVLVGRIFTSTDVGCADLIVNLLDRLGLRPGDLIEFGPTAKEATARYYPAVEVAELDHTDYDDSVVLRNKDATPWNCACPAIYAGAYVWHVGRVRRVDVLGEIDRLWAAIAVLQQVTK